MSSSSSEVFAAIILLAAIVAGVVWAITKKNSDRNKKSDGGGGKKPCPPAGATPLWEFVPYYHVGLNADAMRKIYPKLPDEEYLRVGISYSSSNYVLLTAMSMCAWVKQSSPSSVPILWSQLRSAKGNDKKIGPFSQNWALQSKNPDVFKNLHFPQTETVAYAQANWNLVKNLFDNSSSPYSTRLSLNQGLGDGNVVASPADITGLYSSIMSLKGLPADFVKAYFLNGDGGVLYDQSLFSPEAGISFLTNFLQNAWFYKTPVQGAYTAGLWNYSAGKMQVYGLPAAGTPAPGWDAFPPPMGHNGATWGGSSAIRLVYGPDATLTAIAVVINGDAAAGNWLPYFLSDQAATVLMNAAMTKSPAEALSFFANLLPSLVSAFGAPSDMPEGLLLSASVQADGSAAATSEYRLWEANAPAQEAKSKFVWGSSGTKLVTALNAFATLVELYPTKTSTKEELISLAMTTSITEVITDKVTEYPLDKIVPVALTESNPQPKGSGKPVGILTLLRRLFPPVSLRRNLDAISVGMLIFMQSGINDFQVEIPGGPEGVTADSAWQLNPKLLNFPFGPVAWLTMPTLVPPK